MITRERIRALNSNQRKQLVKLLQQHYSVSQFLPKRLVAFVKTKDTAIELPYKEIREFLLKELPDHMVPTMIEKIDHFPLTPNGKIDRSILSTASPSLNSEKKADSNSNSSNNKISELTGVWEHTLGRQNISPDDNFFDIGGDSILAIKLISLMRLNGYGISIAQLFKNPTINALCRSSIATEPELSLELREQKTSGQFPFHPIQQWFLNKRLSRWDYWNQSLLIELPEGTSYEGTKKAVERLKERHDAFRIRILESPSGWLQIVQSEKHASFEVRKSHIQRRDESTDLRVTRDLANELHKSIDPRKGLMLGASFIDRGQGTPPYLLLACHHLATDAYSWGILLNELSHYLVESNRDESSAQALPVPHSYASFCQHLSSLPFSNEFSEDIDFWNRQSYGNHSFLEPILGSAENLEFNSRIIKQNLRLSEIGFDGEVAGTNHKEVQSRLIACLGMGLRDLTNFDSFCIGIEGHGRSIGDIDLSNTVGWLTSYFPVSLDLSTAHTLSDALIETRIQLQSVPKDGSTFGPLKYSGLLNHEATTVEPELVFNYLGSLGLSDHEHLKILESNPGENRHPSNERICLLEIDAFLDGQELHLNWNYPDSRSGEDFVKELGHLVTQFLSQLDSDTDTLTNARGSEGLSPEFRLKPQSERPCLSYAQERIYFLEQQLGPSSSFNTCSLVSVNERLDLPLFRQATKIVRQRHGTLRTLIRPSEGGHPPYPIADEQDEIDWPIEIEDEGPEALPVKTRTFAKEPMDLEKGPLFQCYHGYGDDNQSVLLFKMHHIITDGLSYEVLYNELFEHYLALKGGKTPNSPKPDFQYTDYAYSERLPATESAIRRDLIFWKSRLAKLPPPLEMPLDFPRPPEQSYRGKLINLRIDNSVVSRIDDLARESSSTAFNVILAAYALMLSRNSGQEDLIIGVPVTNRVDTRFEQVIGLFVNMAPLRMSLSGNPSVFRFIEELSLESREVLSRNTATFERIVRAINPERDPSYPPVFQTCFMYDHGRRESLSDQDFRISAEPIDTGSSNYDLTLAARRQNNRLTLILEYCTDLFSETTASRFLSQTERILNAFIEDPNRSISSISILDQKESSCILREWNDTSQTYPKDVTIHGLVSSQAKLNPEKTAVSFGSLSITYSELETRSNRLAHYLVDQGAKPGMLIALLMDRSIEMLISLIGILKAGCAYVPIDPNFPLERVELILKNSAAYAVLTRSKFECMNSDLDGATNRWIDIDSISDALRRFSPSLLETRAKSSDLAYVIFTSGSTGQPKGVAVEHKSVCNFLLAMQSQPGMGENDSLLAVTTVSFDISCLELFLPLLSGASVVIADSQMVADGQALASTLAKENITIMQATPATWRLMLAGNWEGRPTLKILCGGEAMPKELAAELLPKCKELWNMYGPTETTIWSTCERIIKSDRISIGRPIANTQTYIVDKNNAPVPVGVVGELLIAGDGLARGYWENETLTQKFFVQNPFQSNARAYRTGDLARWLNDGSIECLGRADNQIKVRGFRIEPGEIEAILADVPGVAQAVVDAQDLSADDRRLVAFTVFENPQAPVDQETLAKALAKRLPDFMVPSVFETIETIPINPNGKIDRSALPRIEPSNTGESPKYVPPSTPLESTIADAMAAILSVRRMGTRDNFFRAGGHSLLALRLVSQIADLTGVTISLKSFFASPTVEGLALAVVREQTNALNESDLNTLLSEVESMDPSSGIEDSR